MADCNKSTIANVLSDLLTNIGQKLANKIPKSSKIFETYINKVNVMIGCKSFLINELKDAFFLLKVDKRSGVDNVSLSITKKCFGVLYKPVIYLFQQSLEKRAFLGDLQFSKVNLIYKFGEVVM